MYPQSLESGNSRELVDYRRYLAFSGGFYFLWWFAVLWILPRDYNPFFSRFLTAFLPIIFLALSYKAKWVVSHIRFLFYASCWIITSHFYYLFYKNHGSLEWIIGAYITVTAVSLMIGTIHGLIAYSIFVTLLSVRLAFAIPSLHDSVFLGGLITIIVQATLGGWTKLKALKAMTESSDLFKLLFNSTFEGVLVHANRKILHVNDPLAEMFGYTRVEMIGHAGKILVESQLKEGSTFTVSLPLRQAESEEKVVIAPSG